MAIQPLQLSTYTTVNALGRGADATLAALQQGRSGLRRCDFEDVDLETWIGRVNGLEDAPVAADLSAYDCRNNRLAQLGLEQDGFAEAVLAARRQVGPDRIGVFIGTSTSGILSTEHAYRSLDDDGRVPASLSYRHSQDTFAPAEFVQQFLQLSGPVQGYSTACSSSAKAFASAWRAIQAGLCDAAVVGGVDSLCLTTLYGFSSLQLTSDEPCRPWDAARNGINIGEAAGFALLQKPTDNSGIALLGYGESSDAHHMSAAHPEGLGARQAMTLALERADLTPNDIDYINLHGTATPANDAAEDRAVTDLFGTNTPCSSIKGWTGHTLGASGIVEAIIACLCIEHDFLPANLNLNNPDPTLQANVLRENIEQRINTVLSNSFGFGGSNCSLLFGRLTST